MARRDIIVLGASAGGVEALRTLVAGLPAALPAAVFVVLHVPPHAPSHLHTILRRAGPLPVEAAADCAPIHPGKIYVAISDRHLLIENERMRVTRGPKENRARPAVDVLFRSAAYHFGERVIAAVLTGNLDDGTAGLWAVKDRGGVAIVQSPDEAPFPSMPQNALDHVDVDHVLRVSEMPSVFQQLTEEPVVKSKKPGAVGTYDTELKVALGVNGLASGIMQLGPIATSTCPECHGVLVEMRDGPIRRYRCHTGHSFSSQTLFFEIDQQIERGLMTALRAIEERMLLLQQREQQAREKRDEASAAMYARQFQSSLAATDRLHAMLKDIEMLVDPATGKTTTGTKTATLRSKE